MIFKWLLWNRISAEWMKGRTASISFGVSAAIIAGMTPIWFGVANIPDVTFLENLSLALLGIASTSSVFFLWGGMWRYWVTCDVSTRPIKRLWFLALLLGLCYGGILYYLFCYLPQTRQWRVHSDTAEAE